MASSVYYSPFIPTFSGNGLPVANAILTFFYTGTTNLAPIYSDSGLTTPLDNPVRSDGAARYPNIYLDNSITYGVRETGPDGVPLADDIDPYYPGQAVVVVPDLAEFTDPTGSSLVGHIASAAGSVATTMEKKARERISFEDAGAVGTVATDSEAAIQSVLDGVETARGGVHPIAGHYRTNATVEVPSLINIQGASRAGTVFDDQVHVLAAPLLANKDLATCQFIRLADMTLRGGTHGFNSSVTSEHAGLEFERLSVELQTSRCFGFNKLLQTSKFNVVYMDGNNVASNGVLVAAGQNNHNVWRSCDFLKFTGPHIQFSSGNTSNLLDHCRFESGGVAGQATINLTSAITFRIQNCYFEATHEYALKTVTSDGGVTIDGCTFIGANTGGGFVADKFDVGSDLILFGSNYWANRTVAPLNCFIYGLNDNLDTSLSNVWTSHFQTGGNFVSRQKSPSTSATFDLINFIRATGVNVNTNLSSVTGTLTIDFIGYQGTNPKTISRVYHVLATVFANGNITVTVNQISTLGVPGTVTLTVQAKAGATGLLAALEVVFANVDAAPVASCNWRFDYKAQSTLPADRIQVSIG